jgi:hypothetical protein
MAAHVNASGDKVAAFGVTGVPTSGTVVLTDVGSVWPRFNFLFTLTAARIVVTDAAASGSHGSLKLFDFVPGGIAFHGCRQNYTAYAEGAALTTAAGDAVFDIGVGSVAIAAAADGALGGATDDNIGGEIATTLSGGTGTGTLHSSAVNIDGTSTAIDLALNWSGTAATIDATSYIDVTGTIQVTGVFLGDD